MKCQYSQLGEVKKECKYGKDISLPRMENAFTAFIHHTAWMLMVIHQDINF
jgi:hypothetical protein